MELTKHNENKSFKLSFADAFDTHNKLKFFHINKEVKDSFLSNSLKIMKTNYELKKVIETPNYNSNSTNKINSDRYNILLNNLKNNKVCYKSKAIVWICRNCGYTHIGMDAPSVCPICNLSQDYFEPND